VRRGAQVSDRFPLGRQDLAGVRVGILGPGPHRDPVDVHRAIALRPPKLTERRPDHAAQGVARDGAAGAA